MQNLPRMPNCESNNKEKRDNIEREVLYEIEFLYVCENLHLCQTTLSSWSIPSWAEWTLT